MMQYAVHQNPKYRNINNLKNQKTDRAAELSGIRFGVESETIGISRKDAKFMFTWMLLASMGGNLEILQKKNIYKQELLIRHALQIIERRLNSYTKPMEPVFIAEINKYHPPRQRSQPLFILMSSGGWTPSSS